LFPQAVSAGWQKSTSPPVTRWGDATPCTVRGNKTEKQVALVGLQRPVVGRWGPTDAGRKTLLREER
jgi:hypothetical protein